MKTSHNLIYVLVVAIGYSLLTIAFAPTNDAKYIGAIIAASIYYGLMASDPISKID